MASWGRIPVSVPAGSKEMNQSLLAILSNGPNCVCTSPPGIQIFVAISSKDEVRVASVMCSIIAELSSSLGSGN